MKRNIACYTGTKNLYQDMVNASKSLIMHSPVEKVYFLIEDNSIEGVDLPEIIECINVKDQKFFTPGPNWTTKYTYMAMMRAALCYVFPDDDYILSLDVDTIVEEDISDLFKIDLGDEYYFAACVEPERSKYGLTYTNHGVVWYNLKKLRDDKKSEDIIKGLNTHYYPYVDQDASNYYAHGHILELDPMYNCTEFTKRSKNPKIIHYAGYKQWNHYTEVVKYNKITFDEILAGRK